MCFISASIASCLQSSSRGWVFVRHHSNGVFSSVSQSNPLRLALLSVDPETGCEIPTLLLTFSGFVTLLLRSPNVTPAAARPSHSPALGEFVSLSEAGQEREFFCSSRELIICYAHALTWVLL